MRSLALEVFLCSYLLLMIATARVGASQPVDVLPKESADGHSLQTYTKSELCHSTTDESSERVETMTPPGSQDETCPPWYLPTNINGSRYCACGNTYDNIVTCESGVANLLSCYCMTYDHNTAVIGQCMTGCIIATKDNSLYIRVPGTVEELENEMCYRNHREGQLCGQCKKGYAVPIYSYSLTCVDCAERETNWLLYIAIATLPLTGFLILVIASRINASSGGLQGLVTISQLIASPPQMLLVSSHLGQYPEYVRTLVHPALAFYGIWNLDFFRLLYKPFCLYPNMTMLEVLAFDYFIALYPLAFLAIVYLLIKLHEMNVRLLMWLWWPFHWCTARFRRQFDIRRSLVHAFITFFFLSFTKILAVSLQLLVPTVVHSIHRNASRDLYYYYDGTIEYFGKEHLPYAILAISLLSVFVIFPVFLMIAYQFKCFHCIAERCHLRYTYTALKVFMDACQGDYKDGTSGDRDYRYFPVVYLVLRIALSIVYALTLSVFFYPMAAMLLLGVVLFIAVAQPYKVRYYNSLDIFFVTTTTGLYLLIILTDVARFGILLLSSQVLVILLSMTPFVYTTVCWLKDLSCSHSMYAKVSKALCGKISGGRSQTEELLPHRVTNDHEYTPLLINAALNDTAQEQ